MKTSIPLSKDVIFGYLRTIRRYSALLFILLLLVIYGFLAWRISQLMQREPDQTAIATELKTVGVPKVNEDVIKKMEQLEDNSVSAQTLFDEARKNPFYEPL